MPNDKYDNFKELAENEVGNYTIECIDRGADTTIMAPHGGKIEQKTDEITKLIADDSFNYYSFIGQKNKNNRHLHITSHKFNEPKAVELVRKSNIVITIHGCKNEHSKKDDSKEIFIGGLDKDLMRKLKKALEDASLPVCSDTCNNFPSHFKGENPVNICNKGTTQKGIQFELTESFRDDGELRDKFIRTVRNYLETQT